ncbi:phosphotransferase [Nocardia sp. 004]|uniref:phosphotransferase n=1 Tax=Nocardia sp. 004 TaxID=3385978 RepID=UPI0039A3C261
MTDHATSDRSVRKTNWTQGVLEVVCAELGLDATGAQLAKFTNNAVYNLASKPITVRIPGSTAIRQRVPKVIAVARWLAHHDLPSVRLVADLPQPLRLGKHTITFWHTVTPAPAETSPPNGVELGEILRRLHALPPPAVPLPDWNPLHPISQRIREEQVLSPIDHQFLLDTVEELANGLASIEPMMPPGPIHGDAFTGNLIPSSTSAVICDFDGAALGPREWDLTPVAVGHLRMDYATNFHQQVVERYGVDVTEWSGFPTLRRLREFQLVTSVLPVLSANPSLYEQWRYRFTSFQRNDDARWSPYR